jgi:hypothetical protein
MSHAVLHGATTPWCAVRCCRCCRRSSDELAGELHQLFGRDLHPGLHEEELREHRGGDAALHEAPRLEEAADAAVLGEALEEVRDVATLRADDLRIADSDETSVSALSTTPLALATVERVHVAGTRMRRR